MQLNVLLSSTKLNIITDFQYIFDLAKCSKCQIFIMLKGTNKLYGAIDDCSSIHEIDIPFLVNTDLEFYFDNSYKEIVAQYKDFFIPAKYPYVILPTYYWEMYLAGDIIEKYDNERCIYVLYDKSTKQPITQIQMYKAIVDNRQRDTFMKQLDGFFNRQNFLGEPHVFTNMQNHPMIRKAYDSKSGLGRFLCRFTNSKIDVVVYFYKGMFSLAKSDTLDIDIRFDKFCTRQFMATYRPKKKKNPLLSNRYGVPYSERIHCMYTNII